MRYFIELAYQGKMYHGWQSQPNATSVQEILENNLNIILQEKITVVGAGRTDAGVHATQIYAHFDAHEIRDISVVLFKLNSMLPHDIAVKTIFKVKPETHARFDALSRSYEYHIIQNKNPFLYEQAFYLMKELDIDKMNEAAQILKKYSSFKCFSKSRTDVKTYNCKIEEAYWQRHHEMLVFYITADRFLRNMVRAIVGTLLNVGLGKMEVDHIHDIIKSEDRSKAGTSVPAHGLFLTSIKYSENIAAN